MKGILTLAVLLSLCAAALSGCYVLPAYTYPVYAPAGPAYIPPSLPAPSPPGPGGPGGAPQPSGPSPSQAPGPGGVPQGSAQTCQTVTVEGHSETRVRPDGQRETLWVPTHAQRVCQ